MHLVLWLQVITTNMPDDEPLAAVTVDIRMIHAASLEYDADQ
jgi:hypothetical protein